MDFYDTTIKSTLPPHSKHVTPTHKLSGVGETEDVFAVTELAAATITSASLALASYAGASNVQVDRRLASFWFHSSFRPSGRKPPKIWDEFAGDYQTKDGWIRLHTNIAAHRDAMKKVLDNPGDRSEVGKKVRKWNSLELQEAVVDAGGASALMMSSEQWAQHSQGQSVAREPLVTWKCVGEAPIDHDCQSNRPLAGLRVLDLTRILAGPVATRFLAGFGAEVLRIDPPGWDEAGNIPDMTPGKRCATLNLKSQEDKAVLVALLSDADVLVHGYRADALERMGLGDLERQKLNPGLIDIALNAYGWTGPWNKRRGFDSLVQMSSGISEFGMAAAGADKPRPLTVQALDHGTGYLMAASVLNALCHNRKTGQVMSARLSLAATAEHLKKTIASDRDAKFGMGLEPEDAKDLSLEIEESFWGPAQRLRFPMQIKGIEAYWDTPATPLHTSQPIWSTTTVP